MMCQRCGGESNIVSQSLGLCANCIRSDFVKVLPLIDRAHQAARLPFHLPELPPKVKEGVHCQLCVNECIIPEGEKGYCGLRRNVNGKLIGVTDDEANVSWYYDNLPTNCVASWVCPGGTGAGYPEFSYRDGPEYGFKNLAVFYQACSFDCLFCQNWHYRHLSTKHDYLTAADLAKAVDERTSCICYFGGDPSPQLPYAIRTSRLALENKKGRILRICWETNGSMHTALLRQAAQLSLESGGCIKFDLKALTEELHIALCGVSNRRTLENFRLAAEYAEKRSSPPFLIASTLLIPGYVESEEVSKIAAFVASISGDIPYALLAFHPQFEMRDLPPTSKWHALECLEVAASQGLRNVRLGNIHLLGDDF